MRINTMFEHLVEARVVFGGAETTTPHKVGDRVIVHGRDGVVKAVTPAFIHVVFDNGNSTRIDPAAAPRLIRKPS